MSNPIFQFSTVKREQCKASILIEGLSGRGKSGLALILGKALADDQWEKVFAIDTENKSLNLYEGIKCSSGGVFENFKVANFTPDIKYKPSNYKAFRDAAIEAGAEVIIQDSISHAWSYEGGILDMVSDLKKTNQRYQRDSYAAWGDETIVSEKMLLQQLFRDPHAHIISTVRVKEKMEYDKDENGKTVLNSLGEQQIMQADVKYEPDLVLSMVEPGSATHPPKARVVKSRYAILEVDMVYEFTEALCKQIKEYLEKGTAPEVLLEQQRVEYVKGVKDYLDAHPNAKPIWNELKKQAGLEQIKLQDMALNDLKVIFTQLTI